jgi:two-component system NarL family response regulator
VASESVFVVDQHAIYRSGVVAVLERMQEVGAIGQAGSVEDAREDASLMAADVVILDHDLAGAQQLIRDVSSGRDAHVVICSAHCTESEVLASIQSGATGVLCKDTLTPEGLRSALRAADNGAGILPPNLLASLFGPAAEDERGRRDPAGARLTERERRVLRLIADGKPTREVAGALAYSERTVKSVLHDAITKLGARSRSQAIAYAVRHGLI